MVKGLAALSVSPWRDGTLGLQGYLEWMLHYRTYRSSLPPGTPPRDERRSVATVRMTQLLRNQTVTLGLFTFWGISDRDAYFIPSARYNATDNLWIEAGGNVFVGTRSGMFGALGENDNVYTVLRYSF